LTNKLLTIQQLNILGKKLMNKWGMILILVFILFVFFPTLSYWVEVWSA